MEDLLDEINLLIILAFKITIWQVDINNLREKFSPGPGFEPGSPGSNPGPGENFTLKLLIYLTGSFVSMELKFSFSEVTDDFDCIKKRVKCNGSNAIHKDLQHPQTVILYRIIRMRSIIAPTLFSSLSVPNPLYWKSQCKAMENIWTLCYSQFREVRTVNKIGIRLNWMT